ncbi:MAG: NmrA family NAD(P)-binding protein [Anaerolineae bacterium]|nr:NmrA family NAD(P)-binding protein [Anaerolineae bacterium]
MILVVTANGTLGSAVTRRLLAQGHPVRGLVRSPEKGEALRALGGEVVIGDLRDPPSLARACEGAEQVVAAAHSLMGRGKDASKFVDLQGHKDLIDAAKAAGVEHFVYTSIYPCDGFDCVPFVRMKQEVERYLEASGLSHTIIRPTAFMEAHAEALIGKPILETGKVSLFGRGDNPRNFVAADDVAQVVVMVLTDPALRGGVVDVGGPENLSNMDVVRLYEEQAGRPAKVSHVPVPALQVMYRLLRPFHPGLSGVMQISILADRTDQTFDPSATLERFPIELTRLEEFVRGRVVSA